MKTESNIDHWNHTPKQVGTLVKGYDDDSVRKLTAGMQRQPSLYVGMATATRTDVTFTNG